jgi:hypothetical protein
MKSWERRKSYIFYFPNDYYYTHSSLSEQFERWIVGEQNMLCGYQWREGYGSFRSNF